ncbi:Potassium channel subfamily K member 12 [Amphibalanus amphitrite]|uniref:Potassium channel subfamily K member 12 n=1 Tax=Amphibalanus amphitrite TaxID=1232801 RepID=A0A6A4WQZ9_AMPAM|nr:potassium channel subfamily K member 12-like [Amphibalanus amphitrite]KAF0304511.1 Potassium channel subfamily K member 12 [Amphibalanus amphitrite]
MAPSEDGESGRPLASCWPPLQRHEDTCRFVLLMPLLLLYLLAGAALFHAVEHGPERAAQRRFRAEFDALRHNVTGLSGGEALLAMERLLQLQRAADRRGLLSGRPQWDLAGSFHFCCTVVSTIGWGWTAPHTLTGRLLLIAYGLFGCAGGILFFNLFLERFITLLSFVMRAFHGRRSAQQVMPLEPSRPPSAASDASSRAHRWKPAVAWVLLYLLGCTALVLQLAALFYARGERWDYVKATYFSFVSFATIGFGDVVAGTQTKTGWYSAANFLLTVAGVCCMYSLFNIVSIVIKQALHWLIRRLDALCALPAAPAAKESSPAAGGSLVVRGTPRLSPQLANTPRAGLELNDERQRRNSMLDNITYNRELLQANKVSLAVMQNRLCESVHQSRSNSALAASRYQEMEHGRVSFGSLGSVAIVSRKLEGDD